MIEDLQIVKEAIKAATKQSMEPNFPLMIRSHHVFIPHLNFLRNEWWQWWTYYIDKRGLRNKDGSVKNFNRTFCEFVGGMAATEMNFCAGKRAEMDQRDATAGLFEARIHIEKSPFLWINETGPHFTCLLVFTRDEKSFELAMWEPQNPVFEYELLEKALKRITIYDVSL